MFHVECQGEIRIAMILALNLWILRRRACFVSFTEFSVQIIWRSLWKVFGILMSHVQKSSWWRKFHFQYIKLEWPSVPEISISNYKLAVKVHPMFWFSDVSGEQEKSGSPCTLFFLIWAKQSLPLAGLCIVEDWSNWSYLTCSSVRPDTVSWYLMVP